MRALEAPSSSLRVADIADGTCWLIRFHYAPLGAAVPAHFGRRWKVRRVGGFRPMGGFRLVGGFL